MFTIHMRALGPNTQVQTSSFSSAQFFIYGVKSSLAQAIAPVGCIQTVFYMEQNDHQDVFSKLECRQVESGHYFCLGGVPNSSILASIRQVPKFY